MAARAPTHWRRLTRHEPTTNFEPWRQHLDYTLSLDPHFSKFLEQGATWEKETADNPLNGFTDDANFVPAPMRLPAVRWAAQLDLLLGQIASFCPVISSSTIVSNSTSLSSIWHATRLFYGFNSTGAHRRILPAFACWTRRRRRRPTRPCHRCGRRPPASAPESLLCKVAGRPGSDSLFLSRRRFQSESDRRFMACIRLVAGCDVDVDFDEPEDDAPVSSTPPDEH